MTKMDIVKALAKSNMETVELTQDQAKEVLDTTLSVITEALKTDGLAQITGFGTFKCKDVEAREGHNPRNPEEKIMIPARKQVSFSAGAQLKADVNTTKKAVKSTPKKAAAKTKIKKKKK